MTSDLTTGTATPGIDFSLEEDLLELADEARDVGRAAAADQELREDSWIIGTSRDFSLELAARAGSA